MPMRILYIADSHGRGIPEAFSEWDPSAELMGIWRPGATIGDLIRMVREQKERIQNFNPQHMYVMAGHNSVNYHFYKNKSPEWGKLAVEDIF